MAAGAPSPLPLPSLWALPTLSSGHSGLSNLDWLLSDAEVGDEATGGASWRPQAPHVPSLQPHHAWRCLDGSHPAGCTSCTAAPAPHEARRFSLVSPDGASSEKRLRALLVRCPEWNDAAERDRLASTLEAEEAVTGKASGVPAVLRGRSCADMRKQHMLHLAHAWRYRADCWSAKARGAAAAGSGAGGARSRKRPRPPPAATAAAELAAPSGDASIDDGADASAPSQKRAALLAQPAQQALVLRDRTFQTAGMAEAQVMSSLGPLISGAAAAWEGPSSSMVYRRFRGEGLTWVRVRAMEGALEVTRWLDAVCTLRLCALRAWRDTLGEDGERQLAYMVDAAYHSPESELEAMRYILCQSSAATHNAAAAHTLPDGSMTPQDAAWVSDFRAGHAAALGLVATGLAFTSQQRMEPLRAFLDAAEAVLMGMVRYAQESALSLQHRVDWTSATCQSLGAAAGDRAAAQAGVPPLVERLRLLEDDPEGARMLALATTMPPAGEPPPRFALTMHTGSLLGDKAELLHRKLPPMSAPVQRAGGSERA